MPTLEAAHVLENALYDRPAWAGQTSHRLTMETVRLIEPDLTAAKFREGGWIDIEVSGGQLGGLDLTGASLRRVAVARARLSGAVFSEAELKDVTFEDAKLDLANFRHGMLTRVKFLRCQLVEAAFGGAKLTDVTFTGCDLVGAEFANAKLVRVDLRSSTLANILGFSGLGGATIDTQQMIGLLSEFAAELGIKVDDN